MEDTAVVTSFLLRHVRYGRLSAGAQQFWEGKRWGRGVSSGGLVRHKRRAHLHQTLLFPSHSASTACRVVFVGCGRGREAICARFGQAAPPWPPHLDTDGFDDEDTSSGRLRRRSATREDLGIRRRGGTSSFLLKFNQVALTSTTRTRPDAKPPPSRTLLLLSASRARAGREDARVNGFIGGRSRGSQRGCTRSCTSFCISRECGRSRRGLRLLPYELEVLADAQGS